MISHFVQYTNGISGESMDIMHQNYEPRHEKI